MCKICNLHVFSRALKRPTSTTVHCSTTMASYEAIVVSSAEFWKMNTLSTHETPLSGQRKEQIKEHQRWSRQELRVHLHSAISHYWSSPFAPGLSLPIPQVTEQWLTVSAADLQHITVVVWYSQKRLLLKKYIHLTYHYHHQGERNHQWGEHHLWNVESYDQASVRQRLWLTLLLFVLEVAPWVSRTSAKCSAPLCGCTGRRVASLQTQDKLVVVERVKLPHNMSN